MKLTEVQVRRLLTYEGDVSLSHVGLGLALARARSEFSRNSDARTLHMCTEELNSLIQKYEPVMRRDLERILSIA